MIDPSSSPAGPSSGGSSSGGTLRLDTAVLSGPHTIGGREIELENNAWVLGDDRQCLVIDAPHDVDALVALVGGRRAVAVVCTHAHGDHVRLAPDLGARLDAPVLLHPDDMPVWRRSHADTDPDGDLADGMTLEVAGTEVHVVHTPGHTPGSVCLTVPATGAVFSGDTLFPGGPGSTRDPLADFDTIIASIRDRLFTLDPAIRVLPGHGAQTTVGAEAPHLAEWAARGW